MFDRKYAPMWLIVSIIWFVAYAFNRLGYPQPIEGTIQLTFLVIGLFSLTNKTTK